MKKILYSFAFMLVLLCSCEKEEISNTDTQGQGESAAKPAITITVTQVTSNDILFTTNCSDTSITYYVSGMPKSKYLRESTYSADSIMGFEKSWFEFVSQSYGQPWYQIMLSQCVKGTQSYDFADFSYVMDPESDYVIYAYGINDKGERITYIYTCEVTTADMVVSNNEINVNITKTYSNGVDATITTTNNDSYYISLQRKSYVDYFQGEGHTLGEMAVDLISAEISSSGTIPLLRGNQTITPAEYSCKFKNMDYYLIYFAYDQENGRRSDVHLVPFKTEAN